jgi:hypothetical protein
MCEMHYRRLMRGAPLTREPFIGFAGRKIPEPHDLNIWLAYCAGIMDGEGTICLSRGSNSSLKKADWIYPRLIVVNTNQACLRPFVSLWGGKIHSKVSDKDHHKPCFYWSITGRKAASAARELLSYLLIKRRQAELIIEFVETKPHAGRGIPFSMTEIVRQQRIRDELRKANKRGTKLSSMERNLSSVSRPD